MSIKDKVTGSNIVDLIFKVIQKNNDGTLKKAATATGSRSKDSSIKLMAKDYILEFPLLLSENISYENALIVSDAFEYENAYLIKLLIANIISLKNDVNDASDIIKILHQNVSDSNYQTEGYSEDDIKKSMELLNNVFEESFNLQNLNDLTIHKVFQEAKADDGKTLIETDFSKKEKFNKRDPLFVDVNLEVSKKDNNHGNGTIKKKFQIGVKSSVHFLSSKTIPINLSEVTKKKAHVLKFIRFTTGEIKLSDFLFNKSDIKETVKQQYTKEGRWWAIMKRMSDERFAKTMTQTNIPKRVISLIITKDECSTIQRNYGFDLMSEPRYVNRIIDGLFLLTFAVIDESAETISIYDETKRLYETIPLSSLKKASKKDSISLEDLKSLFFR